MKKLRKGLCSNYLASLTPAQDADSASASSVLRFFIRRTSFKLPSTKQTPIIMIGPGLGIAPFRGFIEERRRLSIGVQLPSDLQTNHLYFGCRYQDKDFYFQDELRGYSNELAIRLRVAFSRQEPKRYVQDLLDEDADLVASLILDRGAVVYVAGNSKLPEEIRIVLAKMLEKRAKVSGESVADGEKIVAALEASNRIQYDCW